ncbi:hypothetical protein [Devosia sp. MC521]|uniref:hypothetical protein n=1 Tax=Devosia sp. MC521 TaxID=2759954 RepID=UPI0015FCBEF1|nr:hypothetical protein [Devosia sp. MC521]MBJ6988968.1 hypothetical protein [Devosia sp. MC521]QMW64401.1 hypothetical protein H4N61_08930 [Devosia sp. MC521]
MLAVTRSRIATQFDDRLRMPETRLYLEFLSFLNRDREASTYDDFAILAVMARRSVLDENDARQLLVGNVDRDVFENIAMRDPAFAAELRPTWILEEPEGSPSDGWVPLVHCLSSRGSGGIDLRNEIGVLSFMHAFAALILKGELPDIIPPSVIEMRVSDDPRHPEVLELRIAAEANRSRQRRFRRSLNSRRMMLERTVSTVFRI